MSSFDSSVAAANVAKHGFALLAGKLAMYPEPEVNAFLQTWGDLAPDEGFAHYTRRYRSSTRMGYVNQSLFTCANQSFMRRVEYDVIDYKGRAPRPVLLPAASSTFLKSEITQSLLGEDLSIVDDLNADPDPLEVSVHQFRVVSRGPTASPTTSGVHQDGYLWIFMHYMGSDNCSPVESALYTGKEPETVFWRHSMTELGETMVVDDQRLHHSATPVARVNDGYDGHRDLLLVTVGQPNQPL